MNEDNSDGRSRLHQALHVLGSLIHSSLGCLIFRGLLGSATDAVINRMADALGILAAQALGSYEVGPWVSWVANILRNQMIEALRRRIVEAVWNYAAEALRHQ